MEMLLASTMFVAGSSRDRSSKRWYSLSGVGQNMTAKPTARTAAKDPMSTQRFI
jgi:hypothetical protein